jgi:hypothetical protein
LLVAGIALAGIVSAIAAASIGRSTLVICGRGNVLDRIAQSVTRLLGGGVIDGPRGSYCVVPSMAAWLLAAVVLVAFCALTLTVRRLVNDSGRAQSARVPRPGSCAAQAASR